MKRTKGTEIPIIATFGFNPPKAADEIKDLAENMKV